MATTFSRSKFGPDEPRRTPTNSGELRSWVISEIWFLFFSWLVLTYHKATHSAWMPKFLPSCYQQGRGQGHTLCSRNPLFPTNHVAREKDHDLSPNPWCSCHRLATCVQICANMHSINHSSVEFEYSHIDMNLHIPMFAKVSEFLIPPFIGCVKCVCQKIGYTHLYIPSGKTFT